MKFNDDEKKIMQTMGITPEAFAASKAQLSARAGTAPPAKPKKGGAAVEEEETDDEEALADGEEVDDVDALKDRIAELEAENEEMRGQLDALDQDAEDEEAAAAGEEEDAEAEGEEEPATSKPKPGKPGKAAPPKGRPAPAKGKPSAEVAKLRAELKKRDVIAAVDAAGRAGKVPPAKRATMISLGMRIGVEALNVTLGAMPKVAPSRRHAAIDTGTAQGKAQASDAHALRQAVAAMTAVDHAVCRQMNVTPEAFARSRMQLQAEGRDASGARA